MSLPNYTEDFKDPVRLPDGRTLYAAYFREIPTCVGQGESPNEALQSLRGMLPMVLDQLRATGQSVPEPLPIATARGMAPSDPPSSTVTIGIALSTQKSLRIHAGGTGATTAGTGLAPAPSTDEWLCMT